MGHRRFSRATRRHRGRWPIRAASARSSETAGGQPQRSLRRTGASARLWSAGTHSPADKRLLVLIRVSVLVFEAVLTAAASAMRSYGCWRALECDKRGDRGRRRLGGGSSSVVGIGRPIGNPSARRSSLAAYSAADHEWLRSVPDTMGVPASWCSARPRLIAYHRIIAEQRFDGRSLGQRLHFGSGTGLGARRRSERQAGRQPRRRGQNRPSRSRPASSSRSRGRRAAASSISR